MKRIAIPGTNRQISALGFGCSGLMGKGRRNAERLLGAAFDEGIRHFDVARSYGQGEAERAVGDFIRSRREQVTVTTKFGMQPPKRTLVFRAALPIGRRLVRMLPAMRRVADRRIATLSESKRFDIDNARLSLETSLRELQTDFIDVYLLHDYRFESDPEESLEFLMSARAAGKVGQFGIGSDIDSVLRATQESPELAKVVQFESSAVLRNLERIICDGSDRLMITHGALAHSYRTVRKELTSDSAMAKRWSDRLGIDCQSGDNLSALMLAYAVRANPGGIVLFSSTSIDRIGLNAKAATESRFSRTQLTAFEEMTRSIPLQT
jgi:D-threo-aldose 1-dehydrogenase